MPTERALKIGPPLRGVYRRPNFQKLDHTALLDSLDCWLTDAKTGRERLATRPGWASYGSQNSVNLIATLNVAPDETYKRLLITAAGGTLYKWNIATPSPTSVGSGISTGRNVQWAPYLGDLFIANNSRIDVYNSETNKLGPLSVASEETHGKPPHGCRLICEWANRIVAANMTIQGRTKIAPHLWFMSRVGDPYDWLFAEDDDGSPVAANEVAGGQIGEPITALIPHNRECILFGSANSLSVLRGNPVNGGQMDRISHMTGPVNATAWCKTSDDWTYMLTRDGLYRMQPGCGENPQQVSRALVPESLLNIDGITSTAYLCYDVRFRGVHIYVTGSTSEYWWFDIERESLLPMSVPGSSILAIGRHDPIETTDKSGVLVGTSTGLKRLDRTASVSGETAAFFKILFPLDTPGYKSQVLRSNVKLGANHTDTVGTFAFYGSDDAEDITNLPAGRKFSVTAGNLQNNKDNCNPRIGGQFGLLHYTQGDVTKHVSFEQATLYSARAGKERG